MRPQDHKTIAILGAGPVGLAAAAHVLERGMTPLIFEAGPKVGHAMQQWSHVRMFSPWSYNVDAAASRLLAPTGWTSPDPEHYPTGGEVVAQYLGPLAARTVLGAHIKTSSRVVAISRLGFDKVKTKGRDQAPFEIRYQNSAATLSLKANAVIDTTGTWFSPGFAGANGLPALGEREAAGQISYAMPDVLGSDRGRFTGKTVAVLGSGHSAIGTLIDLVSLKDRSPATEVVWLLRGDAPEKAFGGGANDKLSARGELGATFARLVREGRLRVETGFRVTQIDRHEGRLNISGGESCCNRRAVVADELIVATGFRPDFSFLSEIRLALDPALECPPALAPLIDPNVHSCGTVRPHGARELAQPEPGFYIAGMKSYGRAPTFLMITGYEQVRSIVADIAGDREAAERVELTLPETGVCSGAPAALSQGCCVTDSCCAGP